MKTTWPRLLNQICSHSAGDGSYMLKLSPLEPSAPSYCSRRPQSFWTRVTVACAALVDPPSSKTSHSPTQKSNCRYACAEQGVGFGVCTSRARQQLEWSAPTSSDSAAA